MPNGTQFGQVETGYSGAWVDQLLQAIGAPTTDSNRAALRAWAASEGTVNSNNPLAISGKAPGATTCLAQCGSSSPIYAYDNMSDGVNATSRFLLGNNYGSVIAGFRSDMGLGPIFNAINQSGWCKGCQGGQYPKALFNAVGGNPGDSTPSSGTGSSPSQSAPGGLTVPNPFDAGATSLTILNGAQVKKFEGWFLMLAGGFVGAVGLAVVLASLGLESKVGRAVAGGTAAGRVVKGAAGAGAAASTSAAAEASAPAPPAPADAYKAGYDLGGADENARQEGQRANERNRRQSGPSVQGAPRRATRPHRPRPASSLTQRERESVESF